MQKAMYYFDIAMVVIYLVIGVFLIVKSDYLSTIKGFENIAATSWHIIGTVLIAYGIYRFARRLYKNRINNDEDDD